jgi:hypothetical protein
MSIWLSVQYCTRSHQDRGPNRGEHKGVELNCLSRIVSDQLLGFSAPDDTEVSHCPRAKSPKVLTSNQYLIPKASARSAISPSDLCQEPS